VFKILNSVPALLLLASFPVFSSSFSLSSSDIKAGEFMSSQFEFTGFGCDGGDQSPNLKWTGAPEGTKSFAVTVYDPDAPTGSGWWHWQLINISATVAELPTNAGSVSVDLAPEGSQHIINDYGSAGFGGACPPVGHGAHRYQFTVHALSVELLDLPENASGALTGYMINANTIESSTIEAFYKRD
jgi:Raf kinase inhibitor-like YbhB/YbcL family protein